MIIEFPVENTIRKRISVRDYSNRPIEPDKINAIKLFTESLDNPFGKEVLFHFFESEALASQQEGVTAARHGVDPGSQQEVAAKNPQKIGTYGFIKGANQFIGGSIKSEPMALEALGYEMEALVLYLTSVGLGSCWLGGTFNRKKSAEVMGIGEDWLLPVVTPYGYSSRKMHTRGNLMRGLFGSKKRKPWEKIFFYNDFDTPLTEQLAGDLTTPLEMVRLGPSASNSQPWRVLYKDGVVHFFEDKSPGYSAAFPFDMQRIDMGIAAVHFDLSAREREISGQFEVNGKMGHEKTAATGLTLPSRYEYVFSWRRK